jgi:hypothetical protein|tara:strand:+ start:544 stop:807 length:264 start_codon:yes stop_codon:yes gene_type:complete
MKSTNEKYQVTITKIGESYSVEMRDHHCNYCCVYEPTITKALQYADKWFAEADEREKANQIHGRAVKAMIELDRKAGITTGMSDGLD